MKRIVMSWQRRLAKGAILGVWTVICAASSTMGSMPQRAGLTVRIDERTGRYALREAKGSADVLQSDVSARVDGHWVRGSDYPKHRIVESSAIADIGEAHRWTVTCFGLQGSPDLIYTIDALADSAYVEIALRLHNVTSRTVHIQAMRSLETISASMPALGASASSDRVLSDSFSEDHPQLAIRDLTDAEGGVHHAVGSQLIYNRSSGLSFFVGALTSERMLSFIDLGVIGSGPSAGISTFQVEATGITAFQQKYSLEHAVAAEKVELRLPVGAGESLANEKLVVGIGGDYHSQLEQYGVWIRTIHHARVSTPSLMGWWSWTAYYFGLNEGTAWSNAQWLAQHLKLFGYDVFHLDEGYQFARGEYTTPDARVFPHGVAALEAKVRAEGLTPGIWTAPFEVSERSWVKKKHPEWLVKSGRGIPIKLGFVNGDKDRIYVLDPTHPGAQAYLRSTYTSLVKDWGIRYIKLDFMDDAAIEGFYHRPNTTAMEAQRIGLAVIREAVGEDVLLDKDGSAMLNPVGIVDTGRISQDTGHTFLATRDASTGVAARYYMNRNFFVSDPDAFTVSGQRLKEQVWHESDVPLTLDEARASIALSAVAGGMYEIGDDLPRLSSERDRLALIENLDLIDMALLGKASLPVDLMTYLPEDKQPSVFFLKETARQSILTVFNWTTVERTHGLSLARLGLSVSEDYTVTDVFDGKILGGLKGGVLTIVQPAHSVRVLKIRSGVPEAPRVVTEHPRQGVTGNTISFEARPKDTDQSITRYRWDFGDGITVMGAKVAHAYTHEGDFVVEASAEGVEGLDGHDQFVIKIRGGIPTLFTPNESSRQHPSANAPR